MKNNSSRTADEFRPISLLSIVGKLYDTILLERLQRVSDREKWIPEYQAGFRRHRSAIEHLIHLQQEAHSAFQEKKILVAAFLDLSKAYDCVDRSKLLQKLRDLGVCGQMRKYLESFLGRRFSCVTYRNATSKMLEFTHGVPQGSPISPFLFNVYCAEALSQCGEGRGMQADDTCVWRSHKSEKEACKLLTEDLASVHKFGKAHNM